MIFIVTKADLKLWALWLRGQGFISDDICYLLGISSRSLSRWQTNMNTFGSVIPKRSRREYIANNTNPELTRCINSHFQ